MNIEMDCRVQLKRGKKKDIPKDLLEGECVYLIDTKEVAVADGKGGYTIWAKTDKCPEIIVRCDNGL